MEIRSLLEAVPSSHQIGRAVETQIDKLKDKTKPFDERKHYYTFGEMRKAGYGHDISFWNAWNGIVAAFVTQPNFRVHIGVFVLMNLLSWYLQISIFEYISLIVVSSMVIVAEMVNTAVEAVGDELAQGQYRKLVGVAKDVSAGAVLISAFFAIIVGILIFGPRLATSISF